MLRFKKILCPIDFSAPSRGALATAVRMAVLWEAELIVLHVQPPIALEVVPNIDAIQGDEATRQATARERMCQDIRARMATFTAESVPASVAVRNEARIGDTTREILRSAEAEGCDLIVMGTHGLTGWRHMMLGSVAEDVVRRAPCPVLTVHLTKGENGETSGHETGAPIQRILCPTDFSEPSYRALHQAGELAAHLKSELCVLYVMEPLDPALGIVSKAEFEADRAGEVAYALLPLIEKHVPAAVQEQTRANRLVRSGKAAAEIVRAAETESADLIVMGTQGQTGWRHLAFGSVAEEVVRTAACPVLTIHEPRR